MIEPCPWNILARHSSCENPNEDPVYSALLTEKTKEVINLAILYHVSFDFEYLICWKSAFIFIQ